ncbi:MAG TPA: DUF3987 domain-containing protein [Thiobacillus sp.]|nr:DUF3987 domain-containing protein [Thiobacillus sp.]
MSAAKLLDALRQACAEAGIVFKDVPTDGRWHETDLEDDRRGKGDGRIRLFADGQGGIVVNWKAGEPITFFADDDRELDAAARFERDRLRRESIERAKADEAKRRAKARTVAAALWKAAKPIAEPHPYLVRKGVEPVATLREIAADRAAKILGYVPKSEGQPLAGRLILAPVKIAGQLSTLELIDEAGSKSAIAGGAKAGGFWATAALPKGDGDGLALLIGEGVSTCLSAAQATGLPAVAALSCSNLEAVAKAMCSAYPAARLCILADVGNGQRHAEQASKTVRGALAIPDFGPDRPERATDFNDLHALAGAEAVQGQIRRAIDAAYTSTHTTAKKPRSANFERPFSRSDDRRPEFRPLQREIEAGQPYPAEALGELLGGAARVLHEIVRAPLAICAQSVLGAAALAVQAHADVLLDGRRTPLSLFLMTLADSGERKSAIDKPALYPVLRREKRLIDDFDVAKRDYERELDAWKAARADALRGGGKARDKATIARALAQVGDEPAPPLAPILLAGEPTLEGLLKLLAIGQPSIGLFSAEGGQFVGGHAMSQDNALKTSAGLSALWDGSAVDRVRAGEGASKLYGRRVSCHLMMQPRVAAELLGSELVSEQGLIARFLIAQPESAAGGRQYVEANPEDTPEIRAYTGRLLDRLEAPLPIRADTRNELEPRPLPLSPGARRLWIEFHDAVEREIVGEFAPIKAFASKAAEHVLRLAGVLRLIDDLDAKEIDEAALRRAIALGEFYLAEALRLAGSAQADPELTAAAKLYAWMVEGDRVFVSTVEIYRTGPAHVRSASRARELLKILAMHGHVSSLPGGLEYEGKLRAEAWRIHREGEA